jgi:anti-sigma factor RsiW
MTCDECKSLLSAFMDDDLGESHTIAVREHLVTCETCGHMCAEIASILEACDTDLVPPNSRAMWLRINNVIENDPRPPAEQPPSRSWRLSFGQLAAAVLCIAIVSSLLTVVAIRNYTRPPGQPTAEAVAGRSLFEKALGRLGLVETPQQARERRLKEQHAAIDYWNNRVQSRRAQWDRMTREAFDRNLQVIDESVNGYTLILEQDPEDDLSGEMLDSVLNEKMNLLRDFSDL